MKSYKATCKISKRTEAAEKSAKVEQILKIQLGQMPTVPVTEGKRGRRIRLTYQPQDGPHWQAQEKRCSPSERLDDRRKKILVAWYRELYGRVQSTEGTRRQLRCTAATQRKRSPLWQGKKTW